MSEEETTLNLDEQAKLQAILDENGGQLFPDDMEVDDVLGFQKWLKKAMAYSKEKAQYFLNLVIFSVAQKNITEAGQKEFIAKYQLAQSKRQQQQGQAIERSL